MLEAKVRTLTATPSIAVCYLARAAEGLEPVQRFIKSYEEHAAGVGHDLVVLYKGFAGLDKQPYRTILGGHVRGEAEFPDTGFTDVPFHQTASRLDYDYFLFLNTFSYFLVPNWLGLLMTQIARPGVGVVGATASYESVAAFRLPAKYRFPIGRRHKLYLNNWWFYPPFPNYHLRTNGFLVAKSTMGRIKLPRIEVKEDAYMFESGKRSFTRQIEKMGLEARVVGRDGKSYGRDDAWRSNTFRQNDLHNLLIGDNQGDYYLNASPDEQRIMTLRTWGDRPTTAVG